MSKAVIRLLKVLSIIVWLSVSLLGFVVFYNFTHASSSMGDIRVEYPESSVNVTADTLINMTVPINLQYNGYVFPMRIKILLSMENKSNEIVAEDDIDVILKPGANKHYELELHIRLGDASKVDHARIKIYVAQIIFGIEMISMTLEQELEVSLTR